jgi:NRPS condensation-like uncharacterized protein
MSQKSTSAIKSWFLAGQDLGEYIGIRFGRLAPGATEPEWRFLPHTDFDGIGGFAAILRRGGADLERLPQIRYPVGPSLAPFLRSLPRYLRPRRRINWAVKCERGRSTAHQPPSAVAWHVFEEEETAQMRRACRKVGVTVNSFLLKHLTKAVRPYLADQSSGIPWMVPVNLRGKIIGEADTANHSSYVGIKVQSYETVSDIHRNIYHALGKGEHWANWYAYQAGRFMSGGMRRYLVEKELAMPEWYLGGFSNLGDWDPYKEITQDACQGTWLFSPPVLRCQVLGAGCVTFQNRLSLVIQVHPELCVESELPKAWMQNWVKEIALDLPEVTRTAF